MGDNNSLGGWMQVAASGSGDFLGAGVNAYVNREMNAEQRDFIWQQYVRQRIDALSDWNKQNEYNSPKQQMERLKEAGLNPNLIYGKGAGDMTATAVRDSSMGSYKPNVPEFKFDSLNHFQDAMVKQIQGDNMKMQLRLGEKELELKEAERLQIIGNTDWTNVRKQKDSLGLKLQESLFDTNVEYGKERVRNLAAQTEFRLDENERQEAMNAANLKIAVQKVINMQIEKLNKETDTLKKEAETETIIEKRKSLVYQREQIFQQIVQLKLHQKGTALDNLIKSQEYNRGEQGTSMKDMYGLKEKEVQAKQTQVIVGSIKDLVRSAQGKGGAVYDFGTGAGKIKSSGQSKGIKNFWKNKR